MRIADTNIPIAHGPEAVLSNGVYVVAALGLMAGYGWAVLPVGLALIVQAYGSMLFHGTPGTARWAQLLDAVGIQFVMTALIALASAQHVGVSPWVFYAFLPAIWGGLWAYVHLLPRFAVIAIEALTILGFALKTAAWQEVALVAALGAAAVGVQRLFPTHSWAHALWHALSAAAQALAVVLLV